MREEKNNAVEKVEQVIENNLTDEQIRENKARQKLHQKEERQRKRATLSRNRERRRQEKIRQIKNERKERKEQRKRAREQGKGKNKGWIFAVVSLSVMTLILSGVLTYTFVVPTAEETTLETTYQRAFYDTVAEVENMDLNLSKTIATRDERAMQTYLVDLAINSELAESNIQELPLSDQNKFNTTKVINQVGDFAKYLNKKLINGESLTTSDKNSLRELYKMNLQLKNALAKMVDGVSEGFSFSSLDEDSRNNVIIDGLSELENLSVEYPQLIYDGPFSDGIDRIEIKGLSNEIISEERAKQVFLSVFASENPKNVSVLGKTQGRFECFNVSGQVNGDELFAQISMRDGKIIEFSYSGSCNDVNINREQATEIALDFLAKNKIYNMKDVWVNLSNNVYTINFAYEEGGVVVYSDLVKIRICAETGMVIGMEASSYYLNHMQRSIGTPTISKSTAKSKLSLDLEVKTCRLSLVPVGNSSEKLCYEFSGEMDGATYYVYIDANNGRQVQMFKVIESSKGTLLM